MGDEYGSEYGGIDDAMEEQALKDAENRMNKNARINKMNLKNKTMDKLWNMLREYTLLIKDKEKIGNETLYKALVDRKYEIYQEIIRREKSEKR